MVCHAIPFGVIPKKFQKKRKKKVSHRE